MAAQCNPTPSSPPPAWPPLDHDHDHDHGRGYTPPVDIEAALRAFFRARHEGIAAVYLFGSEARGTSREDSDVDVGILFAAPPASTLDSPVFRHQADLEALLGRPVQVVSLNTAPAVLAHRVLRDGKVAFEGDRSARLRFEVARQREYFDLLPILRRCTKREIARP